jgi:hypothetical protein
MEPLKIWQAPVQGYAEIADDPQVKHMQSLVTVPGDGETGAPLTLVNHPVLYDGEAAEVRLPPQQLARRRRRCWQRSGLDEAEIAALAEANVIKLRDQIEGGTVFCAKPKYSVVIRLSRYPVIRKRGSWRHDRSRRQAPG